MSAPAKPPKILDAAVDLILAYRPKPKSKPAKKRKKMAKKIARALAGQDDAGSYNQNPRNK
jgi:hypothetical protein